MAVKLDKAKAWDHSAQREHPSLRLSWFCALHLLISSDLFQSLSISWSDSLSLGCSIWIAYLKASMLNRDKNGQIYTNHLSTLELGLFLKQKELGAIHGLVVQQWIPAHQALGIHSHAAEGLWLFTVHAWKASDKGKKTVGHPAAISLGRPLSCVVLRQHRADCKKKNLINK